jgi:DNA-directed RNA polymerase specialized sigma subunit
MAAKPPEFDIYEAFIKDITDTPIEILPYALLKQLVEDARCLSLSPDSRAIARSRVHKSMLRIIPFAIAKFTPRNIPPEDAVGQAFLTIDDCINRYDENKGTKFPGYVMASLKYSLRAPIGATDLDQPFSMPREDRFYGYQIQRSYTNAVQKAEGEPTLPEWHQQTEQDRREKGNQDEVSFNKFKDIHTHTIQRPYLRGGKPISSGNIHTDSLDTSEGTVEEIIPDDSLTTQLDDIAIQDKLETDICPLLDRMSPRNRDIVLKHSSADEFNTQRALAEVHGVSRSRISQIYNHQTYLLRLRLAKMGYRKNVIPD